MPYQLRGKCVIKSDDQTVVKCHDTRAQALAHLRALEANVEDAGKSAVEMKVGQRNSANDLKRIQDIHDSAAFLGAMCKGEADNHKATATANGKSIPDRLKAIKSLSEASYETWDVQAACNVLSQLSSLIASEAAKQESDDVAELVSLANGVVTFIAGELGEITEAAAGASVIQQCARACSECIEDCADCMMACQACPNASDALHQACIDACQKCITCCTICLRCCEAGTVTPELTQACSTCVTLCGACATACRACAVSCMECAYECNECAAACEMCSACCVACIGESGASAKGVQSDKTVSQAVVSKPNIPQKTSKVIPAASKAISFAYIKSLHLPHDEQYFRDVVAAKSTGADTIRLYSNLWGDEKLVDITTEFFTAKTNFWDGVLGLPRPLTWDHAQDATMKASPIIGQIMEMGDDDIGRWANAQLDRNHQYRKAIDALISKRALGASSDSAPQYVEREKTKSGAVWLKSWPLFAVALTTTPCEPRMLDVGSPFWKSIGLNPEQAISPRTGPIALDSARAAELARKQDEMNQFLRGKN